MTETRQADASLATLGPLLLVYPHPDDETFSCGGTAALAIEHGACASLISLTRGEAGGWSDEAPADPRTVGAVREVELREAMSHIGLSEVRFLGFRDSGMAGTPENEDPRSLNKGDEAEITALLVAQIRMLKPRTVVTFGPEGMYGHPDHLITHRLTVAAVQSAADPAYLPATSDPWQITALYFSAAPRERFIELSQNEGDPFYGRSAEELNRMGTPLADIDFFINVSTKSDHKLRALMSHRTQFGVGGPLHDATGRRFQRIIAAEGFVRADLPWNTNPPPPDLLQTLATRYPYQYS